MSRTNNKSIKPYTRKAFLSPDSLTSMAAVHCKIKECGEAQMRISDCNRTIKIWNDLTDPKQYAEMLQKIDSMQEALEEFKGNVISRMAECYAV